MQNGLKIKASGVLLGLSLANIGQAWTVAPPVTTESLRIVWELDDKPELKAPIRKICDALAAPLLAKKKWWQGGLFKSSSCYKNDKFLGGNAPQEASQWTLRVFEDDDFVVLSLKFQHGKGGIAEEEARATIPFKGTTLQALQDPQVAQSLGHQLLDMMPMTMTIQGKDLIRTKFPLRTAGNGLPLGPKLTLFKLKHHPTSHLWLPQVVGELNAEDENRYFLKVLEPIEPDTTYFVQSAQGRNSMAQQIAENLDDSLEKYGLSKSLFQNLLDNTFASGYAGFRIGYPLIADDSLIAEAYMVSIFSEFRAGMLRGLRFNWDFVPEVGRTGPDGNIQAYSWSRPTLGWAFDYSVQSLKLDIDVTPRVGFTKFNIITPPSEDPLDPDGYLPGKKLSLSNELNLGIEVGAERMTSLVLLRFWAAGDISGFLNVSKTGTVNSVRGGLNIYWDILNSKEFAVALVGFLSGENISISLKDPEDNLTGISYYQSFAGSGIALVW
jgi:hypothetical protein